MNEPCELSVLRAFTHVLDAHVARSALDTAGIPTHLADDNIVAANWLFSNAVGGVKLQVPSDRWQEARDLLEGPVDTEPFVPDSTAATDEDASPGVCTRCGSNRFEPITLGRRWAALSWLLLGVPLVPVHRVVRCRQCGAPLEAHVKKRPAQEIKGRS